MKNLVILPILFSFLLFINVSAGPNDNWENIDSINSPTKEPPHATLLPFPSVNSALNSAREDSIFYKLLSGNWKFKWVKKPADKPTGFEDPTYNVSGWDDMTVPCSWQAKGYGIPIYLDVGYSFDQDAYNNPNDIPDIPDDDNAVGSYRRDFTIPSEWDGREVFIHFKGVQSAFYLWINGEYVGYSQGSFTPAEFNITKHLKSGTNTVAAEVYRWCDGSYLEDQDMWRLSGIYRDVFLFSTPQVHLRDFWSQADLDAGYTNGIWKVKANVKNYGGASVGSHTLEVQLLDENNSAVANNTETITGIGANEEQVITFSNKTISNPKKWSAEEPNLYTTIFVLKNGSGEVIEVEKCRTGFKRVEVKNARFYFNGELVKLKGVNRHEHDPDLGRTAPYETMVKDITMMKQFNINTLRMSHYPNDPLMYDLCDKYGIYLMDEANNECHGMGWNDVYLTNHVDWRPAYFDRVFSMIERDKNHASIWSWSLGNEAGIGQIYWDLTDTVHAFDPSRIVHYEGTSDESNDPSDILSHMYYGVSYVEGYSSSSRPLILNEYGHAMGTALGNLQEYWDAIDNNQQCLGACIWDWVDQSLRKPGTTEDHYVYGGFFPSAGYGNDSNFCINGIVSADRKHYEELWECKKVFQYIKMTASNLASSKSVTIKNRYWFTNLNKYSVEWHVMEDGKEIQNGEIQSVDLGPDSDKAISIPFDNSNFTSDKEYFLTVRFKLKENTIWADKGHAIAWEQFEISAKKAPNPQLVANPKYGDITVVESGDDVILSCDVEGREFEVIFNKAKGTMTKVDFNTLRVIDNTQETGSGRMMNCYRAPTDNDLGKGYDWSELKDLGSQTVSTFNYDQPATDEVVVNITNDFSGSYSSSHQCKYTVRGDGTITMENRISPPNITYIARAGILMTVDEQFENVQWYGRGPHENYFDRKMGAPIGIYRRTVDEMFVPQVKPQENGSRQDVRWIRLFNDDGIGMKVSSETPFAINASYYSPKDLVNSRYIFDLPAPGDITLCIDAKQRGLGNGSCGPCVLDKYECFGNEQYDLNITIAFDSIQATDIIEQMNQIPEKVKVCQITYSPLSPFVRFKVSVPDASYLNIAIFNIKGRKVRQLYDYRIDRGQHTIQWDKTNDSNQRISSGIYFYKVTVKGKNVTNVIRKLTLLN